MSIVLDQSVTGIITLDGNGDPAYITTSAMSTNHEFYKSPSPTLCPEVVPDSVCSGIVLRNSVVLGQQISVNPTPGAPP